MARINLLPWRQEIRKEQLRQFLTMLGLSVLLMAAVVALVHIQVSGMISHQSSRNDYLKKEIARVEKQIKEINNLANEKKLLLARMEVIEQLQRNRPEVVHLFDEIVKVMPEGTYLVGLKQNGKSLVLDGNAQSNARVSALMRNIDGSPWLTNPRLKIIKREGKGKTQSDERSFILSATQVTAPNETQK
ncbi:MAG: PilN domain-containing protein [Proteobacteria bacterium]|jgi:type IV pilus assembly protein PilN|nr:PilN domain-containing protein [Pseudomonadota bacterium]